MTRRLGDIAVTLAVATTLAGCGSGGSSRASAHDADVQRAVEDKIKQTVNFNALGQGFTVKFLIAQCIPESDTRLSCIVTGSVGDQPLSANWEGVIDPDTGRFNVHSTG
jgi:hypothetical protein